MSRMPSARGKITTQNRVVQRTLPLADEHATFFFSKDAMEQRHNFQRCLFYFSLKKFLFVHKTFIFDVFWVCIDLFLFYLKERERERERICYPLVHSVSVHSSRSQRPHNAIGVSAWMTGTCVLDSSPAFLPTVHLSKTVRSWGSNLGTCIYC